MGVLPVPVIVDGEPEIRAVRGYWPGDPLPERIHLGADNYVYDAEEDAYLPDRTHVLPVRVIYPDGTEGPVELSWWWPGDPYPPFWQHSVRYVYDEFRGVYVRSGAEHKPARGGLATAGGAWFALVVFGCLAGPAGGGIGFLVGFLIFLVASVCMAVKGAGNISNPPTRENAYPSPRR